jgi:hypothetical protein
LEKQWEPIDKIESGRQIWERDEQRGKHLSSRFVRWSGKLIRVSEEKPEKHSD